MEALSMFCNEEQSVCVCVHCDFNINEVRKNHLTWSNMDPNKSMFYKKTRMQIKMKQGKYYTTKGFSKETPNW